MFKNQTERAFILVMLLTGFMCALDRGSGHSSVILWIAKSHKTIIKGG